ncbi:hypothetical protein V6N11_026192 [Hibiscus sabdariffa]|uniref:RNase H type-1 domain-containing protein n=1 Tax=Hibiscus sabdariffa TaxID=183260 RepID=A0ABR2SVA7_9ROSI
MPRIRGRACMQPCRISEVVSFPLKFSSGLSPLGPSTFEKRLRDLPRCQKSVSSFGVWVTIVFRLGVGFMLLVWVPGCAPFVLWLWKLPCMYYVIVRTLLRPCTLVDSRTQSLPAAPLRFLIGWSRLLGPNSGELCQVLTHSLESLKPKKSLGPGRWYQHGGSGFEWQGIGGLAHHSPSIDSSILAEVAAVQADHHLACEHGWNKVILQTDLVRIVNRLHRDHELNLLELRSILDRFDPCYWCELFFRLLLKKIITSILWK